MLDIYKELTSPLEWDVLIYRLLKHTCNLFQSDSVSLSLLDDNSLLWVNRISQLPLSRYLFEKQVPPYLRGQGLGGYALEVGHAVGTVDYWQDNRFRREETLDTLVKQRDTVSVLSSPVFLQEQPVALLWCCWSESYQWTGLDLARLEHLGAVFAVAIHNARMYKLLDEMADQTRLQHEELTAVKKAAEKVLVQLRTATRELSQPVILIQMELELLAQLKATPEPEVFERMKTALARIVSLMNLYQKLPSPRT